MTEPSYPLDLSVSELDWSRTHPCGDCPFLRTTPFHQGVAGSLPLLMQSIVDGQAAHTCHKTDNRPSCDGPRNYPGPPQHCAGLILMLLKTGRGMDLQLPMLQAAEAGKLDLQQMTALAKRSPQVFTLGLLLAFYEEHLRKLDLEEDGTGVQR